jgi:hypothetical protein
MPDKATPLDDVGMSEQLSVLYAEKEALEASLGTSNPDEIIAMIQNMSEQLSSLYDTLPA